MISKWKRKKFDLGIDHFGAKEWARIIQAIQREAMPVLKQVEVVKLVRKSIEEPSAFISIIERHVCGSSGNINQFISETTRNSATKRYT